jgi:hypothetical protein
MRGAHSSEYQCHVCPGVCYCLVRCSISRISNMAVLEIIVSNITQCILSAGCTMVVYNVFH